MIAVLQRVARASVSVAATGYLAEIQHGLCVLLGVQDGDTSAEADWISKKIAQLRVFSDEDDRMNLSVQDVEGAILLVSQFTLLGNCEKGNRPGFDRAAPPGLGEALYDYVHERLQMKHGLPVKTGIFGASMKVELLNDGPVTLILQRTPA